MKLSLLHSDDGGPEETLERDDDDDDDDDDDEPPHHLAGRARERAITKYAARGSRHPVPISPPPTGHLFAHS